MGGLLRSTSEPFGEANYATSHSCGSSAVFRFRKPRSGSGASHGCSNRCGGRRRYGRSRCRSCRRGHRRSAGCCGGCGRWYGGCGHGTARLLHDSARPSLLHHATVAPICARASAPPRCGSALPSCPCSSRPALSRDVKGKETVRAVRRVARALYYTARASGGVEGHARLAEARSRGRVRAAERNGLKVVAAGPRARRRAGLKSGPLAHRRLCTAMISIRRCGVWRVFACHAAGQGAGPA